MAGAPDRQVKAITSAAQAYSDARAAKRPLEKVEANLLAAVSQLIGRLVAPGN